MAVDSFNTRTGAVVSVDGDYDNMYARLGGLSGGQTLIGGIGTTDDLILQTTSGAGASGADMIFQGGNNGATEFARFLNSGDLGIGTSPSDKLHVNGPATFTGGPNLPYLQAAVVRLAGGYASPDAGRILFGSDTGSGWKLHFSRQPSAGGAPQTGDDLVTIKDNGKVGIGATNPDEKLIVNNGYIKFEPDYPYRKIGGSGILLRTAQDIEWLTDITNYDDGFRIYGLNGGGETKLKIAARHSSINFSDIVTFTDAGKVGIGTTSPSQVLDVAGNIAVSGTVDGVDVSAHAAATASVHGVSASGFEDKANKGAASGYAGLGANGYVPTGQLGSGTPDGAKFLAGDQTWKTGAIGPAGSNGQVQFNDNGSLGADSNLFWDNTNKRLGIGTTSPAEKLDVAGNIAVSGTVDGVDVSAHAAATASVHNFDASGNAPAQAHGNEKHSVTFENQANKGVASGYASLDATGKVPDTQIPDDITRDSELSSHSSASTGVHGAGANTLEHTGNKGVASGYAELDGSTKVPVTQLPDATTLAKGIVQLAGDLAGSADSPQIAAGAIVNTDINNGAAIAYSKLALNNSIVNNDINSSAAIALSKLAALTASRALQTGAGGVIEASAITSTELGYLSGVTSAIQTQLNGKQATGNYITALTGDVSASGPGSVAATIQNDVVTYAKIQNVSTNDRLLGRVTAGAGDVEEIACTAAARSILDDANVGAIRTTLGIGTGDSPTFAGLTVTGEQILFGSGGAGANNSGLVLRAGATGDPYLQFIKNATVKWQLHTLNADSSFIFYDTSYNACFRVYPTTGNVTALGTGTFGTYASAPFPSGSADDLVVKNNGDVGISLFCPDANAGHLIFGSPTVGNAMIYLRGSYNSGTPKLQTYVNGTETIVATAGKVGIGTTPERTLHIKASLGSTQPFYITTNDYVSGTTGSVFVIEPGVASGNTYMMLGALSAGGSAWNNLILQPGGNVGIGTTSPTYAKLDIRDTNTVVQARSSIPAIVTGSNNGGAIYFGVDNANSATTPTAAIETSWGGGANPQLGIGVIRDALKANILMDYSGNTDIRIGTSSKLKVQSDGKIQINGATFTDAVLNVKDSICVSDGTVKTVIGTQAIGTLGNNNFYFITNNASRWFIGANDGVEFGHLRPAADNTYDIGKDVGGTNYRVRDLYVAISGTGSSTPVHHDGNKLIRNASSLRYKKDISNLDTDISALQRLRPVSFRWNEKTVHPDKEDIGLIAEEVAKVYPKLVNRNEKGEPESVRYDLLSVLLLKALQETVLSEPEKTKRQEK